MFTELFLVTFLCQAMMRAVIVPVGLVVMVLLAAVVHGKSGFVTCLAPRPGSSLQKITHPRTVTFNRY